MARAACGCRATIPQPPECKQHVICLSILRVAANGLEQVLLFVAFRRITACPISLHIATFATCYISLRFATFAACPISLHIAGCVFSLQVALILNPMSYNTHGEFLWVRHQCQQNKSAPNSIRLLPFAPFSTPCFTEQSQFIRLNFVEFCRTKPICVNRLTFRQEGSTLTSCRILPVKPAIRRCAPFASAPTHAAICEGFHRKRNLQWVSALQGSVVA